MKGTLQHKKRLIICTALFYPAVKTFFIFKAICLTISFHRALFNKYYVKSFNFLSLNLFEIQTFENITRFIKIIIVRIKMREWPNNLCGRLYISA